MPAEADIQLRVNGTEVTGLRARRAMVHGYPGGPWEVSVEIPGLGYIELDDQPDFILETATGEIREWKKVTLAELIAWLKSIGEIKE